jgi:hypothetical protein
VIALVVTAALLLLPLLLLLAAPGRCLLSWRLGQHAWPGCCCCCRMLV